MRIIAGKYKGKKLFKFELDSTRPTSDLVRSAFFNILGKKIEKSVFLDLFSGTGAVGIEAISRNSSKVYFVDNNKESIKLIKKNLNLISENNYEIHFMDSIEALKYYKKNGIKFDVIFLDPPYKTELAEKSIEQISKLELLNAGGFVFWERDKNKLSLTQKNESIVTKKYGIKYLSKLDFNDIGKFAIMNNNTKQ